MTTLTDTTGVRLVPTADLVEEMRAAHGPLPGELTVPSSVYGLSDDVRTIGVPPLLLVRADLPEDTAQARTRTP